MTYIAVCRAMPISLLAWKAIYALRLKHAEFVTIDFSAFLHPCQRVPTIDMFSAVSPTMQMPPSTKKLVRNLDLAIPAATFQVGGSIPLASPVTLFFQGEDACGSVRLPCSSADYATPGFQALLNACSPAKFGRGDKSVLDPQYRKALCLPADKLALNAALPLEDITQVGGS